MVRSDGIVVARNGKRPIMNQRSICICPRAKSVGIIGFLAHLDGQMADRMQVGGQDMTCRSPIASLSHLRCTCGFWVQTTAVRASCQASSPIVGGGRTSFLLLVPIISARFSFGRPVGGLWAGARAPRAPRRAVPIGGQPCHGCMDGGWHYSYGHHHRGFHTNTSRTSSSSSSFRMPR